MKLFGWMILLGVGLLAVGCGQGEAITRYSIPKEQKKPAPPVVPPATQPARMLGAIVPQGGKTWFFKLTGPPAEVAEHLPEFNALLDSLTFADEQLGWKLPDGWNRQPGSEFRFATLKVDAAPGIDVSVSSLGSGEGDADEYALLNINRWRGQLGLSPATKEQLLDPTAKIAERRQIAGANALMIDFEGLMSGGGGMGRGPMQGGAATLPPTVNNPAAQASPLTFNTPDGWSPGELTSIRKAAFVVRDEGQQADITVIDLPAAANDLLSNVNRWRGQVGLPTVTEAELTPTLQTVPLAEGDGQFVDLVAPADAAKQQTILGVVAVLDDKAWFIKLQGDSALAAREKPHFLEFVKSLKVKP